MILCDLCRSEPADKHVYVLLKTGPYGVNVGPNCGRSHWSYLSQWPDIISTAIISDPIQNSEWAELPVEDEAKEKADE